MRYILFALLLLAIGAKLQAQENSTHFTEKYRKSFKAQQQSFEPPYWDFLQKNPLTKIKDEELIVLLQEIVGEDEENQYYFYTLENRLADYQDFTVFCRTPYSSYIYYLIINDQNELIDSFNVAYDFAEGEYSESAYGKFEEKLKYRLTVEGASDDFEDGDEYYEGESNLKEYYYYIFEDGFIEYSEIEE